MTTSPNVLVYAALDGWRRQMVEHGHELLGAALDWRTSCAADRAIPDSQVLDEELLGVEASHDLDRLQILIDVSATGTSGYQAADWLREHRQLDIGISDHRRILATMSFADDKATVERLLDALCGWRAAADGFDPPPPIQLPSPDDIELETRRCCPATRSSHGRGGAGRGGGGRVAAEQITPYPPGIPAVVRANGSTTR